MGNLIKEAFDLMEAIGGTASKNSKEAILKKGVGNSAFKTLLKVTYDPFMVYYIKKVPSVTPLLGTPSQENFSNFLDLLEDLSTRLVTGNAAIARLTGLLQRCCTEEAKWYTKVLKKDLKIGITATTINKVFKDLVPTYSAMLAEPFKKHPVLPKRFMYDPKLDGYRCLAYHNDDGSVELRTRNGNLIEGYDDIEADVALLPKGFIYDGEILGRDKSFNAVQKSAFKKAKGKDGILNLFDAVTIKEFEDKEGSVPYCERVNCLDKSANIIDKSNSLTLVPHSGIILSSDSDSEELLMAAHRMFKEIGYEGTMIKDADAPYQCKRTKDLLKLKDMDTLDLVVCAVEEGEAGTQFAGTLGALVVDYEGNRVNVGSGYTIAQRNEFWANRNDIINRTIEVQYQDKTTNQKGGKSLRFPVFIKVRDDK